MPPAMAASRSVRAINWPVRASFPWSSRRIRWQRLRKRPVRHRSWTSIPSVKKRAGVVTTGNEVFHGRIEDTFTPVIESKLAEYGAVMAMHTTLADDPAAITAAIQDMLAQGMDMVFCTGGMSVDPDDQTPLAIKNTGACMVSYGAPVLPGAMFLLAYAGDGRPIVGLPGCVMYAKRTIFDLVLPSLIADVPVTAEDLAGLGEGGLCLNCPVCTFPNCGFGK